MMYDVSMKIYHEMAVYKNKEEKRPTIRNVSNYSNASSYGSSVEMDMHTGTHVDMPLHMIEGGLAMDSLDLNRMITLCKVIDLTEVKDKITKEDLVEKGIQAEDFILLKTRNSYTEDFDDHFVYVEATAAQFLKDQSITGVGIDALGIERAQAGHETHKTLLGAGIIIIEGLRLMEVSEGAYRMLALPMKISSVEAAPARVVLMDLE